MRDFARLSQESFFWPFWYTLNKRPCTGMEKAWYVLKHDLDKGQSEKDWSWDVKDLYILEMVLKWRELFDDFRLLYEEYFTSFAFWMFNGFIVICVTVYLFYNEWLKVVSLWFFAFVLIVGWLYLFGLWLARWLLLDVPIGTTCVEAYQYLKEWQEEFNKLSDVGEYVKEDDLSDE